jgi:hypothetical protein
MEVARMLLPCPECRDEREFEQPLCEDGHGVDCPEWMCADCGYALLLATYPEVDAVVPVQPARLAPRSAPTRHAA